MAISIPHSVVEPVPTAGLAWTSQIHLPPCSARALSPRHGHSRGRIAGIPLLSTARTPTPEENGNRPWRYIVGIARHHSRPPSSVRGRPDGESCGPARSADLALSAARAPAQPNYHEGNQDPLRRARWWTHATHRVSRRNPPLSWETRARGPYELQGAFPNPENARQNTSNRSRHPKWWL